MSSNLNDWIVFSHARPNPLDVVMYWIPGTSYGFRIALGRDYDETIAEDPTTSHWKLISPAPGN